MLIVLDRLDQGEMDEIESRIRAEISKSLGHAVSDISFDWTHVREDEAKVKITISIQQQVDPKTWRGGFAGLTSRIKGAMGAKLDSVFPILMARAA